MVLRIKAEFSVVFNLTGCRLLLHDQGSEPVCDSAVSNRAGQSMVDRTVGTLPHFCEQCCLEAALPGNKIVAGVSEALYLSWQALAVCAQTILSQLRAPTRCKRSDFHSVNSALCEHCLNQAAGVDEGLIALLREYAYVIGQIALMVAAFLGVAVYGTAMFFATIFPESFRQGGGDSLERRRMERERRTAERNIEKQQEHRDWEEQRDEQERSRRDREDEYWRKHNRDVVELNDIGREKVLDVRSDVLEDDQRVSEINHTIRAVADRDDDPATLRKMREELRSAREDKNRKDSLRRLKLSESDGKRRKGAAKEGAGYEKEREGREKEKSGDHDGARRCYSKAEALYREADGLYRESKALYQEFLAI